MTKTVSPETSIVVGVNTNGGEINKADVHNLSNEEVQRHNSYYYKGSEKPDTDGIGVQQRQIQFLAIPWRGGKRVLARKL